MVEDSQQRNIRRLEEDERTTDCFIQSQMDPWEMFWTLLLKWLFELGVIWRKVFWEIWNKSKKYPVSVAAAKLDGDEYTQVRFKKVSVICVQIYNQQGW